VIIAEIYAEHNVTGALWEQCIVGTVTCPCAS